MKKNTISMLEKLVGVIGKQAKEVTKLRALIRARRDATDAALGSARALCTQLEEKQRIIAEKDALINSLCIGNKPTPPTMPLPKLPEGTVFLDDTGRAAVAEGEDYAGA